MGIRDWFKAPAPPTVGEAVERERKASAEAARLDSFDERIDELHRALSELLESTLRCDECDSPFPLRDHHVFHDHGHGLTVTCPHCGEVRDYER